MAPDAAADSPQALIDELAEARGAVLAAIDAIEPELLTTPGLAGEWSAQELIAHLGYWVGHASEAIHHAEQGRAADFGVTAGEVDERNAIIARVAREADLATVRARESASVETLVEQLRSLAPALLDERLADGATLCQGIREDGPDHYREHLDDVLAWVGDQDAPDEPQGVAP